MCSRDRTGPAVAIVEAARSVGRCVTASTAVLFCVTALPADAMSSPTSHAAHATTSRPLLAAEAPADEYFGPLKLSALSIRSRIGALGRAYHERTISDGDLLHDAGLDEAALYAWRARYPRDPWLAPTTFHLEQLYQAVQTQQARAEATKLLHAIARAYPGSTYAHEARTRLAAGFPPLHAESPLRATPSPLTPLPSAPASPAAASAAPASAAPASPAPASAAPASPAPAASAATAPTTSPPTARSVPVP